MIALVVSLAGPMAMAGATSPTSAQYKPQNEQIEHFVAGGGSSGSGGGGGGGLIGGLPLTGADVIVLAVAAAALIGGGLALRHVAHSAERG